MKCGRRTEHAQRSLQEKELAVSDKDRLLANLQRQVSELQARVSGDSAKQESTGVPLLRPGDNAFSTPASALMLRLAGRYK